MEGDLPRPVKDKPRHWRGLFMLYQAFSGAESGASPLA